MSTTDISKKLDKILSPIFSYGMDWTEHKDKGSSDHDVSVFAATIKGDMKAQVHREVQALIQKAVTEARAEQIMQDFMSLNVEFDGCVDERDLIAWREQQLSNTTGEEDA